MKSRMNPGAARVKNDRMIVVSVAVEKAARDAAEIEFEVIAIAGSDSGTQRPKSASGCARIGSSRWPAAHMS